MKKKNLIKKLFAVASVVAVSACSMAVPASAGWETIGYMGDLNNDYEVNIADMLALSRYILNKMSLDNESRYHIGNRFYTINDGEVRNGIEYLQKSDLNQDGSTDIFDLVLMRKYVINNRKESISLWNGFDDDDEEKLNAKTETTTTSYLLSETTSTTTSDETETTTSSETSATPVLPEFIEAPVKDLYGSLPSQGEAEVAVFYVDFPDCRYAYSPTDAEIETMAFGGENAEDKNYPFESMSAFYRRSSKGNMNLSGKVFRYTAKENKSAYEGDIYHVKLVNEIYKAFEESVDFTQFDANGDKIIDATLISVPSSAGDTNWWPTAGQYGGDMTFSVDGMNLGHIIVGNAQIESVTDYKNFNSSYLHELGHCMGLPDYYRYTSDKDFEGLHGSAGYELMDDTGADMSCASKLMLGWFKRNQIQVYDISAGGTQTFTLTNAQTENGNCLIIPNGKQDNYFSEFFIVEYTTLDVNNSSIKKDFWWKPTGTGIRVLHVNGELTDSYGWKYWKYASGENTATKNDSGKRFIRVIDDIEKDNLYNTGAVIDNAIQGFNWYDEDGNQTIDPKLNITVGELVGDNYTVTVSEK